MDEKVIVIFRMVREQREVDIEIPLSITANELIIALNEAYKLQINTENIFECYLKSENPVALLKGNRRLAEYGIREGSVIIFAD